MHKNRCIVGILVILVSMLAFQSSGQNVDITKISWSPSLVPGDVSLWRVNKYEFNGIALNETIPEFFQVVDGSLIQMEVLLGKYTADPYYKFLQSSESDITDYFKLTVDGHSGDHSVTFYWLLIAPTQFTFSNGSKVKWMEINAASEYVKVPDRILGIYGNSSIIDGIYYSNLTLIDDSLRSWYRYQYNVNTGVLHQFDFYYEGFENNVSGGSIHMVIDLISTSVEERGPSISSPFPLIPVMIALVIFSILRRVRKNQHNR